jgi:trigger factor
VAFTKLGEVLAGAKVGDTRTTGATLPEDYENAELRGKEASLECRIHGINRLKLPELNEEFIKSIGFENLEDMRKYVRDEMESRIGIEISRGLRGQVQRYLLEKVTFDVPERLSDRQVSQAVVRRMYDLYNQGVPPAEVEKRMDELKTTTRETAVRDLKLAFIMEKMAEKVVVDVTEGEMNAYIANLARRQGRRFDRVREDLIKQGGATSLYLSLRDEKILDQIVAKAKITETTPQAGEQKAPDAT